MALSLSDYVVVIPNASTGAGANCVTLSAVAAVLPTPTVAWADVSGKPAFGTASLAATGAFATAAQGTKADSAVQPAGLTKAAVGLSNADNTADPAKPISTATQTALDGKLATNGTAATVTTNANLTGDITSVGNASTYNGIVPFAKGGRAGSAATSATTGTMTVNMTTAVITITPTGDCTFNASGGLVGQVATFCVTTTGVTSRTLTFGTNFRKTGTLATGTTAARFFSVSFLCVDGTIWQEIARTAVQT